jgi:hypothetical protein
MTCPRMREPTFRADFTKCDILRGSTAPELLFP